MILDVILIGIAVLGCIPMLSCQTKRWCILLPILTVFAAVVVWWKWMSVGPIAQLSPAIVVMFAIPGFLVLELAFPTLARRLDFLERGPLLIGFSMGIWVLIAAVAYRAQLSSDLVIAGVMIINTIGLLSVFGSSFHYLRTNPLSNNNYKFDSVRLLYLICLITIMVRCPMRNF